MNGQTEFVYYYPNRVGRIIFQAMQEVIGHNELNAVLNLANLHHLINNYPPNNPDLSLKFCELSSAQSVLEGLYGQQGGRGLAMRMGRVSFTYGLREFGPELGLTDIAFRMLPLDLKIQTAANKFVEIVNNLSDQRVCFEEKTDRYLWHIERCPFCWQRTTGNPVCHLPVGSLQEALYWVSGRKIFQC